MGRNYLAELQSQFRSNPLGFVPPHLQDAARNFGNLLSRVVPYTDVGDIKAYQDDTGALARALLGQDWGTAKTQAPTAAASLAALLMPGISARMAQDAPQVVRGIADAFNAYPGKASERGMANVIRNPSAAYNAAKWNDGTRPSNFARTSDDFDYDFVPGVAAAFDDAISGLGVRVRESSSESSSSLYRMIQLPNGEDVKVRIADHINQRGGPTARQADINIASPHSGGFTFEEALSDLKARIDAARQEAETMDPDDIPDWAVKAVVRK